MSKVADRVRKAALKLRAMDKNELMQALEKAGIEYTDTQVTEFNHDDGLSVDYYNHLNNNDYVHDRIFKVNVLPMMSRKITLGDIGNCSVEMGLYMDEHTIFQSVFNDDTDAGSYREDNMYHILALKIAAETENFIKNTPIETKKLNSGNHIPDEYKSVISEYNQERIIEYISGGCGMVKTSQCERRQLNDTVNDRAFLDLSWRENGRVYAH